MAASFAELARIYADIQMPTLKRLYILDKDCVYKTSREQWREYLQARASGRRQQLRDYAVFLCRIDRDTADLNPRSIELELATQQQLGKPLGR
jgi:hypothetical protein